MKFYIKSLYRPRAGMAKILLVMKLIIVLLTAAFLQVSANSFAQRLTFSKQGTTLKEVFAEISKQTGYYVLYSNENVNADKKLDVNFKNTNLKDVLEKCIIDQQLEYDIDQRNIIVKPKAPSLLDKLSTVISNIVRDLNVKGKVVDQDGKPLPNASIRVKGKSAVTNTNAEGLFELKGVDEDAVLLVSYVGFKTLEIGLKDAVMPLEIKLNIATGELEEVKVVYNTGYQELNKERATGSFSYVDNQTFTRSVSTNVLDRIIGVTSGLNFTPNPRGLNEPKIAIRGVSTINSNANPLIVVDGFPYDEKADFQAAINNLNPNDVENVTVLKDAAAASIWGVRAGNGVIVITTKKGKYNQATKIQFNGNLTIGSKPDLFYKPILSPSDYLDLEKVLFNQGVYNASLSNTFSFPVVSENVEILELLRQGKITQAQADEQINKLRTNDIRNDVNKYLLQESINQQYALNISGGNSGYKYYSAIGFDRNRNNEVKDEYRRLTLRFDNTYKLLQNIELSAFLNFSQNRSEKLGNTSESLLSGSKVTPFTSIVNDDGSPGSIPYNYRTAYIDTAKSPALLDWRYRPLDELNLVKNNSKINDLRMGAGFRYNIIDGLNLDLKYQYQYSHTDSEIYYDKASFLVRDLVNRYMSRNRDGTIKYNIPNGGIINGSDRNVMQWNFRSQANYNHKWKSHEVSAIAGGEIREVTSDGLSQRIYGFDPTIGVFNAQLNLDSLYRLRPSGTARIPLNNSFSATTNRYISYFTNAAYTLMDKYTFSGSARLDGTNFFGIKTNQKTVPLWSAGLSWHISNENFYKSTLIPFLKLRATYGYNGNTNNSATAYTTITYSPTLGSNNKLSYASITSAPNPELKWERVKVINIGLDFGTKHNRITGSLDYYSKRGLDLIGPIVVDPTTGVPTFSGNRANTKGEGIDLVLNSLNTNGKIKWSSSVLWSYNTEVVTAYSFPAASAIAKVQSAIVLGNPLYSIYSYKWAGLNPKTGDPQIYLADTVSSFANNSKATVDDVLLNGSLKPTIFGSFMNTVRYNNITLSFNLVYKFNYYFRKSSIDYSTLLTAGSWNSHVDYLARWKKSGDETLTHVPSLPISNVDGRDRVYLMSDILVEKGDHIRLQDIRLSYDLSKIQVKRLPFSSAQFFVYVNNLGILWRANKKGLDPDFGDGWTSPSPTPQTIAFGLNVVF